MARSWDELIEPGDTSSDAQVSKLQHLIQDGAQDQKYIETLVSLVLQKRAWARFTSPATGVVREYGTFREFVTDARFAGLGLKLEGLLALIKDEELSDRVRKAWRDEVAPARETAGRPPKDEGNDGGTDISVTREKRGQVDGILARLKRDHPGIAEQVVAGDLSANAAARQLGWRKPRILLGNPTTVAAKLRDNYTPDEITTLTNELRKDTP